MQLVIDASAFFPMCVLGTVPRQVAGYDLVGPRLLWPETLSALREAAWRGALDEDLAAAAVGFLAKLAVSPVDDARLAPMAYDLSRSLGWAKTYDAEYVCLAQLLNAPLLTRDARLKRGAERVVNFFDAT